jgi:hypothetical protein
VPFSRGIVKMPLAVTGAAAVASYFVYFPVQLTLFSQEAWAAALGICAFAAAAVSYRSERWRLWIAASVALAVLGTLVRETLVFVPIAGLVSSLSHRQAERRFRVSTWGVGIAALGAAYAAHYLRTKPITQFAEGYSRAGKGGITNVVAALKYGTDMVGAGSAWPFFFAGLGLAGALLISNPQLRVLASVSTFAALASFLWVGNTAWYETTGEAINYWGATVVPLAYACIPFVFIVLPGAASSPRPTGGRR